MAWNYVNGASAPASSNVALTASVTTGWSVTAGNLLVVTVSSFQSHGTVSDNVNNTNYNLVSQNDLNGRNCTIFYYVPPVGGILTITSTVISGGTMSFCVAEFSYTGGATFSVDATGKNDYTGTTATLSGNMTPAASDLVIFGANGAVGTITLGTSPVTFSGVNQGPANGCYSSCLEYYLGYSSPINPTATISASTTAGCCGVLFRATPSGGVSGFPAMLLAAM